MIEMPIAEFFNKGNEKEFRDLEYQILMEMAQYTRVVIATGGGIVMKNENWGLLRHGIVVYLDIEPEIIHNRLINNMDEINKRPLLQDSNNVLEKLNNLYNQRKEKYLMSDVHVKINKKDTVDTVVTNVCNEILLSMQKNPPLWKSWKEEKDKKALKMASVVSNSSSDSSSYSYY